MTTDPQNQTILQALADLERETGAVVLFAIESGSRAWGFASVDSDWDVRFVYAWPRNRYLKVRPPSDVLQKMLPGNLDLSGWDLRKALHHIGKSNASFAEWLGSPLIYREQSEVAGRLRALGARCFQAKATAHHYLGLAQQIRSRAGDAPMTGKQTLYFLRATLAAQVALRENRQPSVPLAGSLHILDERLRLQAEDLVRRKASATEKQVLDVDDALRSRLNELWLEAEELSKRLPDPAENFEAELDACFLSVWRDLSET